MHMTFALQDSANYYDSFNKSTTEIFSKYMNIISEYLSRSDEIITSKNTNDTRYIIVRGIETIAHVYRILLLYTKNADLVYYHAQRASYYYVEFIGQIGADGHSYLQLNSKDATLFVYKKTLFDINNEFRKDFASLCGNDIILENIECLLHIYNSLLIQQISLLEYDAKKPNTSILKKVDTQLENTVQELLNLSIGHSEHMYGKKLKVLRKFHDTSSFEFSKKNNILKCLAKKLKVKQLEPDDIYRQMTSFNNNITIQDSTDQYSTDQYVNWLLKSYKP